VSDVDETLGGASAGMALPAPGSRYLLVRGRRTAIRFALPPFGAVTIGRGAECEVRVEEPGIAEQHLAVQLDPGIAIEVIDGDTGVFGKSGAERALSVGAKIRAELGDRLRAGSVEISFLAAETVEGAARVWTLAHLEAVLASRTRGALLWLSGAADEARLIALAGASDLIAALGEGVFAILTVDAARAQELARLIARAVLGAELGMAELGADPKDRLLELARERSARPSAERTPEVVAEDPVMREVLALVEQIAVSSAHVLILGETGVGKDVIAQMIHDRSDRALRPLVRVNCVELADSFFDGDAAGTANAAGGTLLLDEVGGLSLRAQLGLGHLLEKWSQRGDVRVIATSNHDLRADVKRGAFRKDLYFRLNRVCIQIPPLRERVREIVPLAERLIAQAAEGLRRAKRPKLSKEAEGALVAHRWPGNIRELRNVIERAMLVCAGEVLRLEHLPREVIEGEDLEGEAAEEVASPPPVAPEDDEARPSSLRDEMAMLERKRIMEALEKYPTQTDAAKALDIPLRTFLNRLDALGIQRPRKR
jgi:DNA-binding NtrC family response regulator